VSTTGHRSSSASEAARSGFAARARWQSAKRSPSIKRKLRPVVLGLLVALGAMSLPPGAAWADGGPSLAPGTCVDTDCRCPGDVCPADGCCGPESLFLCPGCRESRSDPLGLPGLAPCCCGATCHCIGHPSYERGLKAPDGRLVAFPRRLVAVVRSVTHGAPVLGQATATSPKPLPANGPIIGFSSRALSADRSQLSCRGPPAPLA
jgi:hypothetical protein